MELKERRVLKLFYALLVSQKSFWVDDHQTILFYSSFGAFLILKRVRVANLLSLQWREICFLGLEGLLL